MTTIAVTAASGHLGRAIVKALIAKVGAENVIAIARTPEKAADLGVEVRQGDYTDRAGFERALEGVDVVLLVSGMDTPDKRIGQHRNAIEAAKTAGVGKIVYTSVQGPDEGTGFSPVIQSNRQTEQDVRDSGLAWVIGRNGIYIEPDVEYIGTYKSAGEIANCAGVGKCGYTTRDELAYAYAQMLTNDAHNGQTYNLHGQALTQAELADYLNRTFATSLTYRAMSVDEYRQERTDELGEFLGTIIGGIYAGILAGAFDNESDYARAAGRAHVTWEDYFAGLDSATGATGT
ncbi:MAG: SDR family oxidoreductase [Pseudomonadota bacterium]